MRKWPREVESGELCMGSLSSLISLFAQCLNSKWRKKDKRNVIHSFTNISKPKQTEDDGKDTGRVQSKLKKRRRRKVYVSTVESYRVHTELAVGE